MKQENLVSYSRTFTFIIQAWREILLTSFFFISISTILIAIADKEYLVQGTIKQTDLTNILQTQTNMGGALALLAPTNNINDRINSYISLLVSPEIANSLIKKDEYMDILFNQKWRRESKNKNAWIRSDSFAWKFQRSLCLVFDIRCLDKLSALQISDELKKRINIEPSKTLTQGVLTSIANTDTFDISLRGKNPTDLIEMLIFLHDTTNKTIQSKQRSLSNRVISNLYYRVENIENTDVRAQVISVISREEQKLAILEAGHIDYGATWLISPTTSNWPAKPNIFLYYVLSLAMAVILGPLLKYVSGWRMHKNIPST